MGSDNLCTFEKWRNYDYILSNYKIYVYPRPNYLGCELEKHKNVCMVQAPMMDISSSYIRGCIKDEKSIKYIVPDSVVKYIDEMNFYKQ